MNSNTILHFANKNKLLKKVFKGVFSSDNIPLITTFPHCFIANTEKVGSEGQHWVAFYVPDRSTVEFFDSYGDDPNRDHSNYLKNFTKIIKNKVKFQSLFSEHCGYYCLFFLLLRSIGVHFQKVVSILKARIDRDDYVKNFILKHIWH